MNGLACKERLDLRREKKAPAVVGPVERLDPDSVSRDDQLAFASVPDHECEHPAQPRDTIFSVLLVGVHDDLGVAVRSKAMPLSFKFVAQLGEVVDLTVQSYDDRAILVRDRLVATCDVDDAEPTGTYRHA